MAEDQNKRLGDRLQEMDKAIYGWGNRTKSDLLRELTRLGVHGRLKRQRTFSRLKRLKNQIGGDKLVSDPFLKESIRRRIIRKAQEIDAVAFTFARHGIFLQHGVGKGRKQGSSQSASSAKPWISNVLPAAVEELGDILEAEYADIAAASLVLSIPGVIEGKAVVNLSNRETVSAQKKYEREEEDAFLKALNEDIRRMQSNPQRIKVPTF